MYFGKSLFSTISNGNFNVFTLTKHKLLIPSQSWRYNISVAHIIKPCLRLEQALQIGKGTEEYNETSSHNQ